MPGKKCSFPASVYSLLSIIGNLKRPLKAAEEHDRSLSTGIHALIFDLSLSS
jgi:hypothetical protein